MKKLGLIFPRGEGIWSGGTLNSSEGKKGNMHKMALQLIVNVSTIGIPHLGLLTIAGLTDDSFDIKYINDHNDEIDFDEHFDLIGLTGMTRQVTRAYQIADEFRRKNVPVVMGGIHATILPKEVKEHVDSVVVGEGEISWPRLLNDFKKGKLEPFYVQESNDLIDLKKSVIPRYDIIDPNKYEMFPVQTTRGCPHDCDFCSAPKLFGSVYRHKTVDQVINEVMAVKKATIYDKPFVFFSDDNMFANKKFSKTLLKELIPLNIHYWTQCDITVGSDEKLLELMRESGCKFIVIGFENLLEENLGEVSAWKRRQLANYADNIKRIRSYGIEILGTFIIGMDHDTENYFSKMRDFIVENDLWFFPHILTPYEGTKLRKRLEKEDRLLDKDWSHYDNASITFKPKMMTEEELQRGFDWLVHEVLTTISIRMFKRNDDLRAIALKRRKKR